MSHPKSRESKLALLEATMRDAERNLKVAQDKLHQANRAYQDFVLEQAANSTNISVFVNDVLVSSDTENSNAPTITSKVKCSNCKRFIDRERASRTGNDWWCSPGCRSGD